MIKFEHLSKSYQAGSFNLDDVNFEIEKGEFVFLIGASGAGKTTILKLILRELLPTKGNVLIDNENISDIRFKRIDELRQKIGTIYQDFKIIQDRKNPKEVALENLKKVGLDKRALFFPLQLSAGELQRLAIARAFAGGRKIILADEPTGNLDPITTWEIIRLFRHIQTKETTILFATHNSDIVNTLKKRVMVLKNGKIIKDNYKGSYNLNQ
jgi:cell division transport system ATP-binding protein